MPTITLNFTAAISKRISDAFTARLNLDEPATADDVKEDLIDYLRKVVQIEEQNARVEALAVNPDIELT